MITWIIFIQVMETCRFASYMHATYDEIKNLLIKLKLEDVVSLIDFEKSDCF